jgi:hypothetical protein
MVLWFEENGIASLALPLLKLGVESIESLKAGPPQTNQATQQFLARIKKADAKKLKMALDAFEPDEVESVTGTPERF